MRVIESAAEVLGDIDALERGDWLTVDADNTLIMPVDAIFGGDSPDRDFIDAAKKLNREGLANNLSKWRLKRKVKLVEPLWPEILRKAALRGVGVYALTKMETGAGGVIASVEKWRADELKALGLVFTDRANGKIETLLEGENPATVHEGIMFTGSHRKPAVLRAFLAKCPVKPKKIVYIDDRAEEVMAMEANNDIPGIEIAAYRYAAAEKTTGFARERAPLQKPSFHAGAWLSDAEADALLGKKPR